MATKGSWPNKGSGALTGTDETWGGLNSALRRGRRGLPSGSSLVELLAKHRGIRNLADLPPLTIGMILEWADNYKAMTGKSPKSNSGQVDGTDETWLGLDAALRVGRRGLPGGSSLPKVLAKHRGICKTMGLPQLTVEQIMLWADAHMAATGNWPNQKSGSIAGTAETWSGINAALSCGKRGLPGKSSLAKLLTQCRGVKKLPPQLTVEQILHWADCHQTVTGKWPSKESGVITGTNETWTRVHDALRAGRRGLPGGSSLAKLLADHRSVRNQMDRPPLTIQQILAWVNAHKATIGDWPTQYSGQVTGADETWSGINSALRLGRRGLPGGATLVDLLATHRGVRNLANLPPLTIEMILEWADTYKAMTGKSPKSNSGQVGGTDETWLAIDVTLRIGRRGLPGGSSLANLLATHRGVRNIRNLTQLTAEQILNWADTHKATTGKWPSKESGRVKGTDETWMGIHHALRLGYRSLPGGSSLSNFLVEHRGTRNLKNLSPLTIEQILFWVDTHKATEGEWPSHLSGQVTGTGETWAGINAALGGGRRGLPNGLSLAKLLAKHRDVTNKIDLPPLTIDRILAWADAHKTATEKWPCATSGQIAGTNETWSGINAALQRGFRGLPARRR